MNQIIDIFQSILILLDLICICIFLLRFKYARKYGLSLWGAYLVLDFTFTVIVLMVMIFLPTLIQKISVMFRDIMQIFQIAFVLLLMKRFEVVQSNSILWTIFGIFMGIWFIEFYNKDVHENAILYYAETFSKVTIVCLSGLYLLDVFKKILNNYREAPFLFVVIGWLLYGVSFIIFDNPELIKRVDAVWVKEVLLIATAITQCISIILYAIAFGKTKKWVLQNPS